MVYIGLKSDLLLQIQQYSQLEFVIANTSEAFIDLSKTRIYVKCRVSRNNGDKIKITQPGNDEY